MPRVNPVTGKSDVPAEHHAVVDSVVSVFGGVRGPFSMLLHSPRLAERVLGLVTFFRDESVTEPNLRSVAILAAVREREAAYVWSAQVGAARRNGVSEDIIDLLRAKADPGKLPPEEREIASLLPFVSRARYLGRYGWITARVTDDESLEAALEWLRESYWLKAPAQLRGAFEAEWTSG